MEIKNVTQFVNILIDNRMQSLHPSFNNIIVCLDDYKRLCGGCGSAVEIREKIYSNCNIQYENIVKSILPGFTSQLFAGTNEIRANFYRDNSRFIGSLSR